MNYCRLNQSFSLSALPGDRLTGVRSLHTDRRDTVYLNSSTEQRLQSADHVSLDPTEAATWKTVE